MVARLSEGLNDQRHQAVWISKLSAAALQKQADTLADRQARCLADGQALYQRYPLFGMPFAVKDNIDVVDVQTTAACSAFAYQATETAYVVDKLLAAGAILVGKTNMDQFATGLVGTRTPYGIPQNAVRPDLLPGGSSSGSAVAVAEGLISFSLGTDTAGSGRVPAAYNNIVGLKPSRGILSNHGVVPACRSLDCVSVFALSIEDTVTVTQTMAGFDNRDAFSRFHAQPLAGYDSVDGLNIAVAQDTDLEFFDCRQAPQQYRQAVDKIQSGFSLSALEYTPFKQTAELLYGGPWVAERALVVGDLVDREGTVHDAVKQSIQPGNRYTAKQVFAAYYRLRELKQMTDEYFRRYDALVLPTYGRAFTLAEEKADPHGVNKKLGYYTNFVNLLDLAAIAIPAGISEQGSPFGITIIGPAFTDAKLITVAKRIRSLMQA